MRPCRVGAVAALLACLSGCATATPRPGRATPPPPPAGSPPAPGAPPPATAVIGGQVVEAPSGMSLTAARVELTETAREERRVALTDESGRYRFAQLPGGAYSVAASKSGYVRHAFGQRGVVPEGAILEVAGDEVLESVDFRLVRDSVIAGRIMDQDRRPLAGLVVEASRPQFRDQGYELVMVGSDQTNDRGEFRIFGLPPGDYYVSAQDPAFQEVSGAGGKLSYAPTYYPGVPYIAEARRVHVPLDGEVGDLEFPLRLVRPALVSGRVVTYDGRPTLSTTLTMSPYAGGQFAVGKGAGALLRPDGAFTFENVPAGRYVIRARGQTQQEGPLLFGTFLISVEGEDISNIEMTLRPGALVSGELAFEGTPPPGEQLTRILVDAPLADSLLSGGSPPAFVLADSTFHFSVIGGDRFLRVQNLPEPWSVKAVYYQGRDVTDRPLTMEDGQHVRNLRVVLTIETTVLTGTIRTEEGRAALDRGVLTIPPDPTLWRPGSRHIRLAHVDLQGRFRIRGLPAGEYFLAVVDALDEAELFGPGTLERLSARGKRVTLRSGQTTTLDLQVNDAGPQIAGR